jgi:hypothetical protein
LPLAAAAAGAAPMLACARKPPADRIRVSGYVESTEVQVAAERLYPGDAGLRQTAEMLRRDASGGGASP